MSDGGKGSNPRPYSVSQETYGKNYDAIFRKKSPKEIEEDKIEQEEFDRILNENLERAKREKALDEMVRISQEMGLYDDLFDNK
jgi:pyruvate-formate lyase